MPPFSGWKSIKKPGILRQNGSPRQTSPAGSAHSVAIQADYYAGGPVSGGKATITITRTLGSGCLDALLEMELAVRQVFQPVQHSLFPGCASDHPGKDSAAEQRRKSIRRIIHGAGCPGFPLQQHHLPRFRQRDGRLPAGSCRFRTGHCHVPSVQYLHHPEPRLCPRRNAGPGIHYRGHGGWHQNCPCKGNLRPAAYPCGRQTETLETWDIATGKMGGSLPVPPDRGESACMPFPQPWRTGTATR